MWYPPFPRTIPGMIVAGVLLLVFVVGMIWAMEPRSEAELRNIATGRGFTVLSVETGGIAYRIEVEFGNKCPGTLEIPQGSSEVYLETTREGHRSRIADPRVSDLLKFDTFASCR